MENRNVALPSERKPSERKTEGYALFDLDQTLIPWDTQLLFCNFVLKKEPVRRLYLLVLLPFLPFTKLLGAGGMKRVFLSYLCGMHREVIDEYAREFVDLVMETEIYTEVLAEVEVHNQANRLTILNSASPEIWVKYLGERMGFDFAYGTEVEYGDWFPLFPHIHGGNNKGARKLVRMERHFSPSDKKITQLPQSWGYSDSHADLPMLNICEHVFMVHPTEKLEMTGTSMKWEKITPKRPTKTKFQFALNCLKQVFGIYTAEVFKKA